MTKRKGKKAMFYIPYTLDARLTMMADDLFTSRSALVVEALEEKLTTLEGVFREMKREEADEDAERSEV